MAAAVGYTAWASRYIHEFGVPREHFGYVAINDRSNAARNPAAALREPITMDDYLAARMIRWPLCLLDMDVPVDGADAFVITTAERARDLPLPPVLINAAALGTIDRNEEDQTPGLHRHGQHVVVEALRAKSDFWIDGVDVYFPYDGFSIITLSWIENAGFCEPGEAGEFIEANWDDDGSRILIGGRVPVNPHGGALSEGATQGSGHVREAVHQLQGLAGRRQVRGRRDRDRHRRRVLLQRPGPHPPPGVGRPLPVSMTSWRRSGKWVLAAGGRRVRRALLELLAPSRL